jgi:DNA-binding NarL/FixJ family response regulator
MKQTSQTMTLPHDPSVLVVGDAEHAELRSAVDLLRETACLTVASHAEQAAAALAQAAQPPELVVLAQSRPGTVRPCVLRKLEQLAPLAGVVALLGSWCEGQARSSRPTGDIQRLYWYDFPMWWTRQLAHRRAGRCPDWARPGEGARSQESGGRRSGLVLLSASNWETAAALADELALPGYATVWQPPGRRVVHHGATAGIWEGGQLDDREAGQLTAFCRQLARDEAPVVALLDFPRRDRCRCALEAGASAVLGKPWLSVDLVGAIEHLTHRHVTVVREEKAVRAA